MWRLSEYKMHEKSHTVYHLPIHLPGDQQVCYQQGEARQTAEKALHRETLFTAWFLLNRDDVNARHHLYCHIPQYYVKCRSASGEKKMRRHNIMMKMYSVSPRDTDKLYLRLLKLHVPGATSYEDLKTINGELAPSFKEVCISLRLLKDDMEYYNTLKEASAFTMFNQLLLMFATVCLYCHPTNVGRHFT